jgi:hypothetical protein
MVKMVAENQDNVIKKNCCKISTATSPSGLLKNQFLTQIRCLRDVFEKKVMLKKDNEENSKINFNASH